MNEINKKDKKYFKKTWSDNDVEKLIASYGKVSVSSLCSELKKSKCSVTVKAFRLGLTKPREIDLFKSNLRHV